MRRIIPGAVGGMLQGAPKGEPVLAQAAYRTRQRVSGAGIIVRFYARPPCWPGRGCCDLRLRSPCSAGLGRPPGISRAIPRTSPLAETRSWTPPAAHPRSAAAETCLGAPESWVLEDYHEPAVCSYGWRPFPGILPLSVILGSRIASTKGGLHSGVTHVTACANDGHASAAAAADRIIFRNAHQCVAHDSSVTPSSFANYSTRNARPVPASTPAPVGTGRAGKVLASTVPLNCWRAPGGQ